MLEIYTTNIMANNISTQKKMHKESFAIENMATTNVKDLLIAYITSKVWKKKQLNRCIVITKNNRWMINLRNHFFPLAVTK